MHEPQSVGANALALGTPSSARTRWQATLARVDEAEAGARPALPAPVADSGVVTVEGTLERITFRNEANGWTIARVQVPRQRQPITVAGTLPTVHIGETLRLEG